MCRSVRDGSTWEIQEERTSVCMSPMVWDKFDSHFQESPPYSVADNPADLFGPSQVQTPDSSVHARWHRSQRAIERPSSVGPLEYGWTFWMHQGREVHHPYSRELSIEKDN